MTISQLERFKCRPEVRQGGLPAYISPVSEGLGGTSAWGRLAKLYEQVGHEPC